jgi:hypothetical protein
MTRVGFAFVGKPRVDANLKYKYTGPRTGNPGRSNWFDSKVNWKDFSKWSLVSEVEEQTVHSSVLCAPALHQDVLLVCILWQVKARTARKVPCCEQEARTARKVPCCEQVGQIRREVVFSTSLQMFALKVV